MKERHDRIVRLARDTGCRQLLFDSLELEEPSLDDVDVQRSLNPHLNALKLRIAIVVPNCRLAYLARLVYGDEDYQVFYNDLKAAMLWLDQAGGGAAEP
jgi:hypothetical protein